MIVGLAGHVDHGKTALVKALTGVDGDRLKEEKARGVTIDLGFAFMARDGAPPLGFIDVPGHERFVHSMLAGASGIDIALMTVAANEGIKPQTLEHLAILDLLGIDRGLIAITKADLASPERLAEVARQITAALAGTALAGAEAMPVSALTGEGVAILRSRLESLARQPRRGTEGRRFRLAVDRVFTLPGVGVVVTGTVLSGAVRVGDRVQISPSGLLARVRSLHAQNEAAEEAGAGDRCALNLAGPDIAKEAIHRGDVALDPALHAPTGRIDAELKVLASQSKPIRQGFSGRLHHASAEVGARVVLLDDKPIAPGETAPVQLVLEKPIATAALDRFVIRDPSAQRTMGGGEFLDLRPPARKRRTPARQSQRAALGLADPEAALAALLAAPPFTADLAVFARDRALSEASAERLAVGLAVLQAGQSLLALAPERWNSFVSDLSARLADYHAENPDRQGMGREQLRLALEPRLPRPAFDAALQKLAAAGEVALDGAFVRLRSHEARLAPRDAAAWEIFAPILDGAQRFRPPRVRDIAVQMGHDEREVRRVLKLAGRMGLADEAAHDHFFLRKTVREMVWIAADLSEKSGAGEFSAAQFRDRLDNGRKVAIQILDFFDRHGVTLRRGDMRRINRHRLDLFGAY